MGLRETPSVICAVDGSRAGMRYPAHAASTSIW